MGTNIQCGWGCRLTTIQVFGRLVYHTNHTQIKGVMLRGRFLTLVTDIAPRLKMGLSVFQLLDYL
jgi:hypothetical protein